MRNGAYHRRDVTLAEDACQVWRGQAPQLLAALNTTMIGIVAQTGEQNLAAVQRAFVYIFDRILAHLTALAGQA